MSNTMRKEERPLLGGSKSSYGATPQHTARRCAWPQRRYVVTFLGLAIGLSTSFQRHGFDALL